MSKFFSPQGRQFCDWFVSVYLAECGTGDSPLLWMVLSRMETTVSHHIAIEVTTYKCCTDPPQSRHSTWPSNVTNNHSIYPRNINYCCNVIIKYSIYIYVYVYIYIFQIKSFINYLTSVPQCVQNVITSMRIIDGVAWFMWVQNFIAFCIEYSTMFDCCTTEIDYTPSFVILMKYTYMHRIS